jgi:hypothetical protein
LSHSYSVEVFAQRLNDCTLGNILQLAVHPVQKSAGSIFLRKTWRVSAKQEEGRRSHRLSLPTLVFINQLP